ncbi:MAG: hypothetical protein CMQ14_02425 [Gammaproteobacteria bacterium]|nr:hypothetical protein [Gammaproteobacteria bacterium]
MVLGLQRAAQAQLLISTYSLKVIWELSKSCLQWAQKKAPYDAGFAQLGQPAAVCSNCELHLKYRQLATFESKHQW